jgi:serine/threonine-protein kinase mTOR
VLCQAAVIDALTCLQHKAVEDGPESSGTAKTAPLTPTFLSTSSDDYYQTVVIRSLLGVLKDPSLSAQHHTVIEAIMAIFKTQGLKCVTFLPEVSERLGPMTLL